MMDGGFLDIDQNSGSLPSEAILPLRKVARRYLATESIIARIGSSIRTPIFPFALVY